MLTMNGSGIVTGETDEGIITAHAAAQVIFSGEFEIDISAQSKDEIFCFEAVQFSGNAVIRVADGIAVNFVGCSFDKDSRVTLQGEGSARFAACSFGENSTIDCTEFEFLTPLEALECEEEKGAGFLLGEAESGAISWKGPMVAAAFVGALSGAVALTKAVKKRKVQNAVQHVTK